MKGLFLIFFGYNKTYQYPCGSFQVPLHLVERNENYSDDYTRRSGSCLRDRLHLVTRISSFSSSDFLVQSVLTQL